MQQADRGFAPRRPSAAFFIVLVLHVLLAALLWQTLRQREVSVRHELAPLVWVNTPRPLPLPPPPTLPTPRERDTALRKTRPLAAPPPAPAVPHESTLIQVPAPVATAPAVPASAASDVPRLLDTEATRMAIRQMARQPLLQERNAEATGIPIERTDTGLAAGVAEAGHADCLKDGVPGGILGIPLLAVQAARGKCAK